MPIKHRIYVLWHFFFRTYIYIYVMIARSRYFVLYEAHNVLYDFLLLLNICTGVEWLWCIKGIFLSVINDIVFFPMIPSECVHKINVYIVISLYRVNWGWYRKCVCVLLHWQHFTISWSHESKCAFFGKQPRISPLGQKHFPLNEH